MKRYLLFLVLFSFTISVYCQTLKFQKDYFTLNNFPAFEQLKDSTYLLSVVNTIDTATWILKSNKDDSIIWNHYYRATYPWRISIFSVKQLLNGNYIALGSSGNGGFSRKFLLEMDTNGLPIWYKEYRMDNISWAINSAYQNSDSSFILIGELIFTPPSNITRILIMKTDPVGNLLWSKVYKDSTDNVVDGLVDKEGNIVITGTDVDSLSTRNVLIAKFNSSGVPLWSYSYLPPPPAGWVQNIATSIRTTADSGYIVSAIYNSVDESVLLKVDKDGYFQWATGYNNGGPGITRPVDAEQTKDSGYILTGWVYTGSENLFLLKTDSTGIPEWMKSYNNGGFSRPHKVHQSYDGGYMVAGEYAGWSYFIKTDSAGSSGCNETVISTNYYSVPPDTHQVFLTDSNIVFIQSTRTINVSPGPTLNTLCSSVGILEIQSVEEEIEINPNPFSERLKVQFSLFKVGEKTAIVIYDVLGEKVYQQELSSNSTSAELNLSFLQQGVYFLNVKANGESWTKKIVKM